jgi:diaminopimelate decarboxylase
MDHFAYKNGSLFAEDVAVENLARQHRTPLYIYSKNTFLDHLGRIRKAWSDLDTTVCYSVKACGNVNILKFLAQAGAGFDIVSGGELFRVQKAGGDMSKVVYAGVGKTDAEIIQALNAGIGYFNIESEAELENLIALARKAGKRTKAALRVNPDVDPGTHKHITTGVKDTKFGVDVERAMKVFADFGKNEHVRLCAIHVHLGSGGKTIDPYVTAVRKILPVIDDLRKKGFAIEALDLGGGYAADYETDTVPSPEAYARGLVPMLTGKNLKMILEPGKTIAANAAILVTRVLFLKTGGRKKFVIVDAGMNDLMRPALYDAFHFIWPAQVKPEFVPAARRKDMSADMKGLETADVVGPICEATDFFAKDRSIPPVQRGDLLSIFTAGAYGFTMANNYNARPLAAEVLIDGDKATLIRRRQTYEDLVAPEMT